MLRRHGREVCVNPIRRRAERGSGRMLRRDGSRIFGRHCRRRRYRRRRQRHCGRLKEGQRRAFSFSGRRRHLGRRPFERQRRQKVFIVKVVFRISWTRKGEFLVSWSSSSSSSPLSSSSTSSFLIFIVEEERDIAQADSSMSRIFRLQSS